jgi:FAD/FMN-containing dehydrogenase/Fe-S oxidoreductase
MEEQQRRRILDDLKGFIKGELRFDPIGLGLYSTDASILEVRPAGVVVPADEEDVRLLVRYAAEHQIPLIPRGAGSGLAGEALGTGLVVDLSQHFRDIGTVNEASVRVQPGVTCRVLNDHLAAHGRRFAPDPASAEQCTVGGMIATNASGARLLRHGYTREHVRKLRIVLDSGDAVEVGREPVHSPPGEQAGHLQDILAATALLLEENAGLIRSCQPRTPFNRCGYLLHDVLHGDTLDLARLLVGSEGTLAIITEAELRTIPLPAGRALVLLGYDSLDGALRAVSRLLPTNPSACELIDRRLLTLARGGHVPPEVEAVLLVEYETDSAEEASWSARRLPHLLERHGRAAQHTITALEPLEIEYLWHLREAALPSLYGLRTGPAPVAFVEDVGVPPEELGQYLHRVQEILQEHETTASFLVHAGTGQVHTRPFLDLANPQDVAKLSAIADKVHALALDLGGTVSTQHGTGLIRTPWVGRQYRELYPVLRQLKAIFDPQGIFNPGKIVDPDPALAGWPLRRQSAPAPEVTPLLRWPEQAWQTECLKCNGCGACRTETPPQRMCPIFHATHGEAASPRAKANLLRGLLRGSGEAPALASDEVRNVADLCVNCRMCALECPARVNIPKLMLEAKAQNVAEHGMDRKEWFLARAEGFARWGSAFALLANVALASPTVRWWLELLFGLSRRRRLPRLAGRSFLNQARRSGWTRRNKSEIRDPKSEKGASDFGFGISDLGFGNSDLPRVAYFVDVYANYIDPLIGAATVAVLRHNGVEVFVPPGQRGCGMSALSHGDVEGAREAARQNLRVLAEAAREGYTIVCSEPTAALMLSRDYLDLVDDDDASLVARQTTELTTYLWRLHRAGRLRTDFRQLDLALGHHVPCHLKALGEPPAGPQLLALIPGVRVHTADLSCSGMAGTYGLGADDYATSLAAGRPMLREIQRPRVLFGSTECGTCRMQMEDGGGKRTLHPVQYLALAYGLVPEIARRLHEPLGELVLG